MKGLGGNGSLLTAAHLSQIMVKRLDLGRSAERASLIRQNKVTLGLSPMDFQSGFAGGEKRPGGLLEKSLWRVVLAPRFEQFIPIPGYAASGGFLAFSFCEPKYAETALPTAAAATSKLVSSISATTTSSVVSGCLV